MSDGGDYRMTNEAKVYEGKKYPVTLEDGTETWTYRAPADEVRGDPVLRAILGRIQTKMQLARGEKVGETTEESKMVNEERIRHTLYGTDPEPVPSAPPEPVEEPEPAAEPVVEEPAAPESEEPAAADLSTVEGLAGLLKKTRSTLAKATGVLDRLKAEGWDLTQYESAADDEEDDDE